MWIYAQIYLKIGKNPSLMKKYQPTAQYCATLHYLAIQFFRIFVTQIIISRMAKPIKETPELFGKDAERFEKLISKSRPASEE